MPFLKKDREEYLLLENDAKNFYSNFKTRHGHELQKYYLKLQSKLLPLRVACSGGKVPVRGVSKQGNEENEGPDTTPDDVFSKFAFTSKFNVLIKELEKIRDDDATSKTLVFSQFSSTLKWLQDELPRHGFQYRTLTGDMTMKQRSRALHDFQHDPPTTVFLLSMRSGAVGINLTQANRVFLMEPSLNPALEEQAIGRVHRLGQKRNVEIIRLIMKDSIESRIRSVLIDKYGSKESDLPANGLVGSLNHDKSTVFADEYDFLFGISKEATASSALL